MTEELREDEIEHSLVHCGTEDHPYGWSAHKVKVGKKSMSLENGYGDTIYFNKRNFAGDGLEIHAEWEETKTKRCEMGHDHVIEKKSKASKNMTLQWEHVEQLVEWLNHGSWTQVKGGPTAQEKIDGETLLLLDALKNGVDPELLKSQITALRRKIYDKGKHGRKNETGD